jgi:predicted glycosyltransferase/nucleoside-diphosphate-sugar epimerase
MTATLSLREPGAGRLVVVTGAAGFIGSWLCEALLAGGWRVRGVDSFTGSYEPTVKRGNIAGLFEDPGFELVEADLAGADTPRLVDAATAVVHLAAEGGASTSWEGSFARYVERNVLVTQHLLDAVDALHIERFIYASSAAVYGDAGQPLSETCTPHPVNPYGASKLAGEHVVRTHASRGLPAVILRYFSVYGPRQRPDMAAHRFIESALDGRPLTVYGDGTQTRDMTYVTDAVAATVAALTAPLDPGAVINVATGQGVSVLQLVSTIGELLGDGCLRVIHEPARDGDVAQCEATIATAGELLGWQPSTDLVAGLDHQILWHRSRRHHNGKVGRNGAGAHPSESRGPRLMIYSQDGLGLGHLRRASSIATEFLNQEPSGWVLTTSDSPLGTLLHDIPNHDYLKLPSIVKSGPGDWHPLSLPLDFGHLRQLRSRLIHEAAMAFAPDVLLVDHMPHGAMGELIPVLDALRGGPTRVVLGLRDIIDAPQVVRQRWRAEGAYDALARYYDEVLIYGSQDVFDVCNAYDWPDDLANLAHYCGFVCTPQAPDDPKRIRARRLAGVPRGAMISAMAGGGADAHELMSTLLDALPAINAERPCVLEIVTGPFMPDAQRLDLKRRAEALPVRMRTMVRNPLSRVAAADLVVAMAGYNTTMEVLRQGTPTLLVPRRGPSSEQRMRASQFAQRGWVSQLDPDELRPDRLAAAVLAALTPQQASRASLPPDLGGLARAVERLHANASAALTRAPRREVTLVGKTYLRATVGEH